MPQPTPSTGLTITNPLVLYRTLLATGRVDPDPAQHRLALHLQKLYYRLKDYRPEVDFGHRLNQLNHFVNVSSAKTLEPEGKAHKGNQLRNGIFSSVLGQRKEAEATGLTRRLTSQESAVQVQSPQGLLLYGDVGTGKSLLVDLLADSLPNSKKRRWHFNTFMLETFARLEQLRRSRLIASSSLIASGIQSEEHSLLWLARDMISISPILFLDEFQLPDRAASKILSNLFTSFFHLGGVLIATSNRMPEELANASGVDFAAPPSSRLGRLGSSWGLLGGRNEGNKSNSIFAGKGDFTAFLEVLRARCEVWNMEGGKDWRRCEAEKDIYADADSKEVGVDGSIDDSGGLEPILAGNLGLGYEQSLHVKPQVSETLEKSTAKATRPKHYHVRLPSSASQKELNQRASDWTAAELGAIYGSSHAQSSDLEIHWETKNLRVYNRNLTVPRSLSGVSKWTFEELCGANLGPADYITIASTFHTLILTHIPVLTLLQKNEARRLITLLDALYEARCKILISADAGPDQIFFPETKTVSDSNQKQAGDGVYPETFSEIYQDQTSPFRPNVSSYTSLASPLSYDSSPLPSTPSRTASARSILADEDSDFGPVYGAGHRHGTSDGVPGAGNEIGRRTGPDFARTGTFIGDDERFAYKRARSRLWEMCGSRWWARDEEGWWRPLGKDVRRWEGGANEPVVKADGKDVTEEASTEESREKPFRHGGSPFRTSQEAPPRFGFQHAWGMMTWGKKAGAWGKGPEGLDERKKKDEG